MHEFNLFALDLVGKDNPSPYSNFGLTNGQKIFLWSLGCSPLVLHPKVTRRFIAFIDSVIALSIVGVVIIP